MPKTTETQKDARRKRLARKWSLRMLGLAVGVALGELCPLLPIEKQVFCHLAAKLLALFGG